MNALYDLIYGVFDWFLSKAVCKDEEVATKSFFDTALMKMS